MRAILFRGKRIDNGEWVYGDLIRGKIEKQKGKWYIDELKLKTDKAGYLLPIVEVIPETIGQFTGLLDKNGTRIFEGDVIVDSPIVCISGRKQVFIIEWDRYGTGLIYCDPTDSEESYQLTDDVDLWVIGNIHDNPELLEVGR